MDGLPRGPEVAGPRREQRHEGRIYVASPSLRRKIQLLRLLDLRIVATVLAFRLSGRFRDSATFARCGLKAHAPSGSLALAFRSERRPVRIAHAFRSARLVRRLRGSESGPQFDDLVAYHFERGYSGATIQQYVLDRRGQARAGLACRHQRAGRRAAPVIA